MAGNEEAKSDKIEIVVSSDPSASHTHTPTPVEDVLGGDSFLKDNLVMDAPLSSNELMTIAKGILYESADRDLWGEKVEISESGVTGWISAEEIYEHYPRMVSIPVTSIGKTALHVAARLDSTTFVEGLVNSNHMAPEDLEIRDSYGNTAFWEAAASANIDCRPCMIRKNQKLPLIPGQHGLLPLHVAVAANWYEEPVHKLLSSKELDMLSRCDSTHIKRLFLIAITREMLAVARMLFAKYPHDLSMASDDEWIEALERGMGKVPVGMPVGEDDGRLSLGDELKFLTTVWSHFRRRIRYQETLRELRSLISGVILETVSSGKDIDALQWFLATESSGPLLREYSLERDLLHATVRNGQQSILDLFLKQRQHESIIWEVDNGTGNNILHIAASYEAKEASSKFNTKLDKELLWFKEVGRRVPTNFRTMKNKEGKTPKDTFYAKHKELSKEGKEAAKGIANSGMLVAALIATVAFAAALTVPGDKNSPWFIVFILTNAVALFTSSASIISFLSIFTSSWFTDNEFILSLALTRLGLGLLMISIVTMVITFASACFLIFGHIFKWVAYVVASLGGFTSDFALCSPV